MTSIPAGPPPAVQVPAPVAVAPTVVPPSGSSSARSSLGAALAQLVPPAAGAVTAMPPAAQGAAPPRVQLGFRDGTSTTLEPGSSQSRALADIARSLARRD